MNAFAHFKILNTIIFVLSRGMSEISEFLRDLCKKVSKKGLTNEFCWCIRSCVKAKASLMFPALKVPLSIFNTSTHMKRRINYEHCNRLFWKPGL